jgi:hypothetical protein
MKKWVYISLVGILLGLFGVVTYFKGRRYEVVVTQERIDTTLREQFPQSKSYFYILKIDYHNPEVKLLEGRDRVQIGLDATLNIKLSTELEELGGGVTLTSGIRYDVDEYAFYLSDVVLERLDIQGVPEKLMGQVRDAVTQAAEETLAKYPVYMLDGADAKKQAARLLLKDFEVKQQAVYITLGL